MNVNVTSPFDVYVVEKICVNQYLVFSGTLSPKTLTIVVGKLINVDAKNADGGAKSQSRITASFTSSETEFAYNSSQAYAVNTIDRS